MVNKITENKEMLMKTVNTLGEAMSFFLKNSSDSIICKKDGEEKKCNSFPEAKEFYKGGFNDKEI